MWIIPIIVLAAVVILSTDGFSQQAHAVNPNLFVSAENSQFSNFMSGPQVIEVLIIDPDINNTNEAKVEPDVTVNGKILRMVQAVDGNWYGYFSDIVQANFADDTTTIVGVGLDFGEICTTAEAGAIVPETPDTDFFGDSSGVAISAVDCTTATFDETDINVLREAKQINTNLPTLQEGQIGIEIPAWPFIQLYSLIVGDNVVVQYNKGGDAQTTTLTFDTVDQFAGLELDRTIYPRSAQVHVTVTDLWLNIDPTDEDSWTWDTSGTGSTELGTFYQVFNENGGQAGAAVSNGVIDINAGSTLSDLMIVNNGILILNVDAQSTGIPVITLQDNDDTDLVNCTTAALCAVNGNPGALTAGSQPTTITELAPNSGIFGTYDELDTSNIATTSGALTGTSATIDYNETPTSVVVGFDSASIDIQPVDVEWNSGEEIPVVLVDGDPNKNSRADEDLDLNNPDVDLIPALRTGSPFTLGFSGDDLVGPTSIRAVYTAAIPDNTPDLTFFEPLGAVVVLSSSAETVEVFSDRGIFDPATPAAAQTLIIDLDATANDLFGTISDTRSTGVGSDADTRLLGSNLFNYDVRGLTQTGSISTVDIFLVKNAGARIINGADAVVGTATVFQIVNSGGLQGLVSLDGTINTEDIPTALFDGTLAGTDNIGLAFVSNVPFTTDSSSALVADFFSFGFTGNGVTTSERVSNQIIRIELEETGDNTSTFAGSLEYVMVNQLNILDESTYLGLLTIADNPTFIVIEDLTDVDSPRVNYADLAADGTILPVADQEEAPSHSGVVSFDLSTYKIGDTVVITLQDADLNVDSDLIDIFTVVDTTLDDDIAEDAVGTAGLGPFSFGPLGRLLDITFDDVLWSTPPVGDPCLATLSTVDTGLGVTGFTLVETGIASGVFVGNFAVPSDWCRIIDNTVHPFTFEAVGETTTGLDLKVNYLDFRDALGAIIEVGDCASIIVVDSINHCIEVILDATTTVTIQFTFPTIKIDSTASSLSTVTVPSGVNGAIDFSDADGTLTTPSQDLTITTQDTVPVTIQIQTSTLIEDLDGNGETWDGIFQTANVLSTSSVSAPSGQVVDLVISVGSATNDLTLDKAMKFTISGQAGKTVSFKDSTGAQTEVTATCDSTDPTMVTLGAGADCKIDDGSDLLVLTRHLTDIFSSSSGGGGGGGGGGGDRTKPVIGDVTFAIDGIADSIDLESKTILEVGQSTTLTINVQENQGTNNLEHVTLYVDSRQPDLSQDFKTTHVRWEKNSPVLINNPNGLLDSADIEITPIDAVNSKVRIDFAFAVPIDDVHLQLVVWDLSRNQIQEYYPSVLQVISTESIISETTKDTLDPISEPVMDAEPMFSWQVFNEWAGYSSDITSDEEFLSHLGMEGEYIPKWIKGNNAKWLKDGLISQQELVDAIKNLHERKIIN